MSGTGPPGASPATGGRQRAGSSRKGESFSLAGAGREAGRSPDLGPHAEGDGEPLTAAEGERHVALVFGIRMQGSLWPLLPPQGVWIGGGRMIDEGASLIAAPA